MTMNDEMAQRAIRESLIVAQDGGTFAPTWRPATVQARSVAPDSASVLVDGDSVALDAQNVTGTQLSVGQRVLVLFVPPHGIFVHSLIGPATGWVELDHQVLTAAAATFTFTPPQSGYLDLKFIMRASSDQAGDQNVLLTLNGDLGANYFRLPFINVGGVVGVAGALSTIITAVPATANRISNNTITIVEYMSAREKQIFSLVSSQGSISQIGMEHITWFNAVALNPIVTVQFTAAVGNFEIGNSMTMLGLVV